MEHQGIVPARLMEWIAQFRKKEFHPGKDRTKLRFGWLIKGAQCLAERDHTKEVFADCKHFSITADPGLHGRQDTLGLIVCSPDADLCAYGPALTIREMPLEDTTDQFVIDLLEEAKTCRGGRRMPNSVPCIRQ